MSLLPKTFERAVSLGALLAAGALSNPAYADPLSFDSNGKVSPGVTLDNNQKQAYAVLLETVNKYISQAGLTKLEKDGNNPALFQELVETLTDSHNEQKEILEAAGNKRKFMEDASNIQLSFDALDALSKYQSKTRLMGELKADMTKAFTAKESVVKGTAFKPVTPTPVQAVVTPQPQTTPQVAPVPLQPKQPSATMGQFNQAPVTQDLLPGIFNPDRNNAFENVTNRMIQLIPANARDHDGRNVREYIAKEANKILNQGSRVIARNPNYVIGGTCLANKPVNAKIRTDAGNLVIYMRHFKDAWSKASLGYISEMNAIAADNNMNDSGAPLRFPNCTNS